MIRIAGLLILPALLLSSCLDPVDPPELNEWGGEIVPFDEVTDPDRQFTGDVAMLTTRGRTETRVRLWDATPGVWYGWVVRMGGCLESGEPIGDPEAFPPFRVESPGGGEAGVGQGFATLSGIARTDVNYALELFSEGDEDGSLLACGDLELFE